MIVRMTKFLDLALPAKMSRPWVRRCENVRAKIDLPLRVLDRRPIQMFSVLAC